MRLNRVENTKRNIFFGLINKIVSIFMPFVVRTVLIKEIGVEYLGISSLFSSILTVLSLTELGFSNAVVYSMYKPIAEEKHDTICALLNFYRTVYRIIGTIILCIGLVLIPFLPKLINGTYPSDINIIVLYLIYLANTVLSYFMYAYLSVLLAAHQREDMTSKINIIVSFLLNLSQIIVICLFKNYYAYSGLAIIFTIINNLRIAVVVKRMFPQYVCKGKLSKEILEDIKKRIVGLMLQKICSVSRNSLDSIFASAFLGLTITAMYGNYYYVIAAATAFMIIISNAITGGIGNSVALESVEKNYADMEKINFIYMWMSGWVTICMLCLYQNFMYIWVGEKLMFPFSVVILFCIYFYVLKMGDIRGIYFQVNGLWWESRYFSLIESVGNIILNYLLGKYFGIRGIIVATLLTLFFINFCCGTNVLFKCYFKEQKVSRWYAKHLQYALMTCVIGCITYYICCLIKENSIMTFLLRAAICVIFPNIMYLMVYYKFEFSRNSIKWLIEKIMKKSSTKK